LAFILAATTSSSGEKPAFFVRFKHQHKRKRGRFTKTGSGETQKGNKKKRVIEKKCRFCRGLGAATGLGADSGLAQCIAGATTGMVRRQSLPSDFHLLISLWAD